MTGAAEGDEVMQRRVLAAMHGLRGFGFALVDEAMNITWVNDSYRRIFGYDPTGSSAADIVHPDDLEFALTTMQHYTSASGPELETLQLSEDSDEIARSSAQLRFRCHDGSWKTCVVSLQSMLEVASVRSLVIRFVRTRDQAPLERAVRLLATAAPISDALEQLSEYCILDGDRNPAPANVIIWWDRQGEHFSTQSIASEHLCALTDPAIYRNLMGSDQYRTVDVASLPPEVRVTANYLGFRSVWVVPVTDEHANTLGVILTWTPLPPGGELRPTMFLNVGSELVKLALLENQRREIAAAAATTDHLTQLSNRSGLAQYMDQIRTADFPLGALFIDLDDFKRINDVHGHKFGDQILREVAHRIISSCRTWDYVARLGGDEFVVLTTAATGAPDLKMLAQRLVDAMAVVFAVDGQELSISASIGVSAASDSQELDSLIERADNALYEAKRSTKGGFAASSGAFV